MLTLNQILALLDSGNYPENKLLYKWREVYYGMSLHIDGACPSFKNIRDGGTVYPKNYFGREYQEIFETYLFNRHPRENEYTRQWRMSQYRPIQKEPFQQLIQVVTGAIFQDSGYGIVVENKEDNDYIWGNNFDRNNLTGYVSGNFQNICNDPNGFFIVIPAEPSYATTTNKIEPKIYYISSKCILFKGPEEVIFIKDQYTWVVNRIGYFRFAKDGEKYFHVDQDKGYYAHLFDRLPIHIAGGQKNSQGFMESWLDAAKAVADDYVSEKTNLQLVNKEASHPFIIEASEECPSCKGAGKKQYCNSCGRGEDDCDCDNIQPLLRECKRCGGSGMVSHNPGDRLIAPKEDMENDLIKIVNPDIEVNKFHAENVKAIFQALKASLHLHYVDEAQSAVAKDKDMETRYQFILRISNDLFDRLISGLLNDILSMRNVSTNNGVTVPTAPKFNIIKPTQFQIKTSADLLADLDSATKAQIPEYQRAVLLEDYVDKQFGGNEILKKKTCFINQADILAMMSSKDKQDAVMNGAAAMEDWQFSLNLPKILDQIVREKGSEWFLNGEYTSIYAEADRIFKIIKPPLPNINDGNTAAA